MRRQSLYLIGIVSLVFTILCIAYWFCANGTHVSESVEPYRRGAYTVSVTSPLREAASLETPQARIDTADVEHAFYFPFVGKVVAQMGVKKVNFRNAESRLVAIPFQVFTDGDGRFIRAEFSKENTDDLEWPVKHIEEAMQARGERVDCFSKSNPKKAWADILQKVSEEVTMAEVKRININHVDYEFREEPSTPVYIVNVFGFDALPGMMGAGDPKWARTRFVYSEEAELLWMDNCL